MVYDKCPALTEVDIRDLLKIEDEIFELRYKILRNK